MTQLIANPLTAERLTPYGWMLGKPLSCASDVPAFSSAATDFWHEHLFDAGEGGEPEILWVNYRLAGPVTHLEKHLRTQQAIVPLTGRVIHIVALSGVDGSPDLSTLAAFVVAPGQGLCMAPQCWHATRVLADEVTCLMLTRRSTTVDLIAHLNEGPPAAESSIVPVSEIQWATHGESDGDQ